MTRLHTKVLYQIKKVHLNNEFLSPFTFNLSPELGQSLIETVVGIFILVMGIASAVGLASYSLHASTSINRTIIATGLAREGIEAVKSMRDNNWFKASPTNNCYDWSVTPATNTATCYQNWLNPGVAGSYNISPSPNPQRFTLDFNPAAVASTDNFWRLTPATGATDFNLFIEPLATAANGTTQTSLRYYRTDNTGGAIASEFYRRITLTTSNAAPFNQNTGTRLTVVSDVWWRDNKNCPAAATYELARGSCRVSLQTYLTNWKAY